MRSLEVVVLKEVYLKPFFAYCSWFNTVYDKLSRVEIKFELMDSLSVS